MDGVGALGGFSVKLDFDHVEPRTQFVLTQQPLQRILAFTGRSIDDVVNDPIVKNEVLGYFKLHRQINRQTEIRELERQWNPLG